MKALFSFFAESAIVQDDGVFNVLRGGLDDLVTPTFPATSRHLALVARVSFAPEECGKEYQCVVKVIDPQGKEMSPDLTTIASPLINPSHPDKPYTITMGFLYDGFTVLVPGFHVFRLFVDDELVSETAIEAILRATQ